MFSMICFSVSRLKKPLLPTTTVMRFKTRLIFLSIIFFIFFVSFKIMEPEFEAHPDGHNVRSDSDYDGKDKFVNEYNSEIDALVKHYIQRYSLHLNNVNRTDLGQLWSVPGSWVTEREIHPNYTPEMGAVLHALATAKITNAGLGYRGTQLKMTLTLEGGQRAVFKPKWYERDDVVQGKPYDGPDRHNGEIAAFHLNRMLDYRRSPLVVGRVIDMQSEIEPVAEKSLLDTFYTRGANHCFYGKCMYCKGPQTGVCGEGTKLEGTVVLWLPRNWKFKNWRHPWGRTYRKDIKALWETDDRYCNRVKHTPPYDEGPRLMDIVDATVFDYLIGNADRHHYETFKDHDDSMLVMLDSAKSFGNPHHDERSILAPLYQCCSIRQSTWKKLDELKNGALSGIMREILSHDPIAPILAEPHLTAMDRRLVHILQMIDLCVEKRGLSKVFITDKYSSPFTKQKS